MLTRYLEHEPISDCVDVTSLEEQHARYEVVHVYGERPVVVYHQERPVRDVLQSANVVPCKRILILNDETKRKRKTEKLTKP
jgi:hypothetical protein